MKNAAFFFGLPLSSRAEAQDPGQRGPGEEPETQRAAGDTCNGKNVSMVNIRYSYNIVTIVIICYNSYSSSKIVIVIICYIVIVIVINIVITMVIIVVTMVMIGVHRLWKIYDML